MTGRIRDNRLIFEEAITKAVVGLPAEARQALITMLAAVRAQALANAAESLRRAKWMQHAYWRIVAVYAGHLRRLARRVVGEEEPNAN